MGMSIVVAYSSSNCIQLMALDDTSNRHSPVARLVAGLLSLAETGRKYAELSTRMDTRGQMFRNIAKPSFFPKWRHLRQG